MRTDRLLVNKSLAHIQNTKSTQHPTPVLEACKHIHEANSSSVLARTMLNFLQTNKPFATVTHTHKSGFTVDDECICKIMRINASQRCIWQI